MAKVSEFADENRRQSYEWVGDQLVRLGPASLFDVWKLMWDLNPNAPREALDDGVNLLLNGLCTGALTAAVVDDGSTRVAKPEEWRFAEIREHDGSLVRNKRTGAVLFAAPEFQALEVLRLFKAKKVEGRRGPKPKYDWVALELALRKEIAERGAPMAGDQGWSSQADVVTWALEWFAPLQPSNSIVKEHVRDILTRV